MSTPSLSDYHQRLRPSFDLSLISNLNHNPNNANLDEVGVE